MKETEELEERKKQLLKKTLDARINYLSAEDIYFKCKTEYEMVDRELAMLNRTILPSTGTGKASTPSLPQFTIEQVKAIANKLGIKIAGKEDQ